MWLIAMDHIIGVEPYELTGGQHVIGRGRSCDLIIREPTLSRRHARIGVGNRNNFILEDLGSKNGTFVDDVKVSRQPLPAKCIIRLGDVRLYLSPSSDTFSDESADETESRKGILPKSISGLPLANLTRVQRKVFDLMVAGCDENAIAGQTGRSFHTVHHHVQAIFRKLGVHSRSELLALVLRAAN